MRRLGEAPAQFSPPRVAGMLRAVAVWCSDDGWLPLALSSGEMRRSDNSDLFIGRDIDYECAVYFTFSNKTA